MIATTDTLAELAVSHPGASRVFHARGLDFCCRGRRSLADACTESGLDADSIAREIDAERAAGPDEMTRWAAAPLPELIDHIRNYYHARLRLEIPALIAMADRVAEVHADKPTCPRALPGHLREMHQAVLSHLEKEEAVLFPMIEAGATYSIAAPIGVMEMEHDDHAASLARLRGLTADLTAPPEACTTWRALYLRLLAFESELMDHIHLENNVLFPRALGR